ncbi:hypothetical protein RRG08_014551 [Elysia crispata]|uniref:Uncharacterized protein n=1 Tax=Elysia crispata TaxID=231223 RepID=A0AAE1CPF5_9GAST|nr:hypothetical protein RRG08_014551 [Elysia crispata]
MLSVSVLFEELAINAAAGPLVLASSSYCVYCSPLVCQGRISRLAAAAWVGRAKLRMSRYDLTASRFCLGRPSQASYVKVGSHG